MKDFSDTLEQELVAASRRLTSQAEVARTRPKRLYGRRPLLVAAILAGLGGSAAVAATQPWKPDSFTAAGEDAPSISSLPAPARQRELLAALRRPATAEDRSPAVDHAVRFAGSAISTGGVRTDEIRKLADSPNGPVVLVPVTSWSPTPVPGGYHLDDALCVLYPDTDGAAKACWDTAMLQAGQAFAGLGKHIYGLAPDGVAYVRLKQRSGPDVFTSVTNNMFDAESQFPRAVVWLNTFMRPIGP